jgi:two-component system, LytTR family, response regulator
MSRMAKRRSLRANGRQPTLDRIPVKKGNEVTLVPVRRLASVVAEGELLHLVTLDNERHTLNYRLKDLEPRLDPQRFVRLGRGALAAVDSITKVTILPSGMHMVSLTNGQELPVSRIQARTLRERLLKL